MNTLIPCPECSRHLKRTETSCPFCGAGVGAAMAQAPERSMPATRLGRSALFAFAAAAVGAAACSTSDSTDNKNGYIKGDAAPGAGGEMATPVYGAPFPTGGTTGAGGAGGASGATGTAGKPAAGGNLGGGGDFGVPIYGLPMPDGGVPGANAAADGATDGATDSGAGGFVAIYGSPPAP